MHQLHADVRCTAWMHDLLNMVQLDMLVVDPRERKMSNVLMNNLRTMDQKCQNDDRYCTNSVARPATGRRQTGMLAQLNHVAQKHVKDMENNLKVHGKDKEVKRVTLQPPR